MRLTIDGAWFGRLWGGLREANGRVCKALGPMNGWGGGATVRWRGGVAFRGCGRNRVVYREGDRESAGGGRDACALNGPVGTLGGTLSPSQPQRSAAAVPHSFRGSHHDVRRG